jgi:hypothetical protein
VAGVLGLAGANPRQRREAPRAYRKAYLRSSLWQATLAVEGAIVFAKACELASNELLRGHRRLAHRCHGRH